MVPQFLTKGKSLRINLPRLELRKLEETVKVKVDAILEYPGSSKSEGGGVWYLKDWINYQIERRVEDKKGKELW